MRRVGGFIDVETTGLDHEKDEIIEFAIVLFSYCPDADQIEVLDQYCGLREPDCSVSRGATEVNGLTKRKLKGMTLDNEALALLMDQAEFFISHNAQFDFSFVCDYTRKAFSKPWYCSMNGISWRRKGFQSKALQSLLKDHNIETEQAHRALDDVKAALLLLSQKDKKGKTYFSELINKPAQIDTSRIISHKEVMAPKTYDKSQYVMNVSLAALQAAATTTKEVNKPADLQYSPYEKQNKIKFSFSPGCATLICISVIIFILYLFFHN